MKELKIEKIKLSEMSLEEQRQMEGGEQWVGVITVSVATTTTGRTMDTWPGCNTQDCLTKNPGTQDSCGLCTTRYAC